jgi:hypothetical protein
VANAAVSRASSKVVADASPSVGTVPPGSAAWAECTTSELSAP